MSLIKVNNENGISEITIDRPEALNAMNQEVVAEFTSVIQDTVENKETGVIIITGATTSAVITTSSAPISVLLLLQIPFSSYY